jgi:hypothetical protein
MIATLDIFFTLDIYVIDYIPDIFAIIDFLYIFVILDIFDNIFIYKVKAHNKSPFAGELLLPHHSHGAALRWVTQREGGHITNNMITGNNSHQFNKCM